MTISSPDNKGPARLLTTAEATEYLWNKTGRTASQRLYRALKAGRIQSKVMSGRHFWPLTTLRTWAGETATEDE